MSKNNVTQSINNKHTEDNSNQIRQSISAKHRFEANHNYFVISIYALSVIILSALAIYLIWHFNIISGIMYGISFIGTLFDDKINITEKLNDLKVSTHYTL